MLVRIEIEGGDGDAQTLAVRLVERALRHLDYPVVVAGGWPNPTPAEMADLVADARANDIQFLIA